MFLIYHIIYTIFFSFFDFFYFIYGYWEYIVNTLIEKSYKNQSSNIMYEKVSTFVIE